MNRDLQLIVASQSPSKIFQRFKRQLEEGRDVSPLVAVATGTARVYWLNRFYWGYLIGVPIMVYKFASITGGFITKTKSQMNEGLAVQLESRSPDRASSGNALAIQGPWKPCISRTNHGSPWHTLTPKAPKLSRFNQSSWIARCETAKPKISGSAEAQLSLN